MPRTAPQCPQQPEPEPSTPPAGIRLSTLLTANRAARTVSTPPPRPESGAREQKQPAA
ncbi:hypothetical protein [Mangrovactinospora gilvigrisea]|uniref:hypothetical protein n=1 Tax=Mangrovactinospora gilvigrisea TaxID=1428644 RepID=UPI000B041C18|nr:hypothetical protein [Mangrovactinospora gilvigrisea]